MHGEAILARSLSIPSVRDRAGHLWQYHSRSDRHSKLACWGVIFELMIQTPLLQRHVTSGKVAFGINHRLVDFEQDRSKDLDLVLCTPNGPFGTETLADLVPHYGIALDPAEQQTLSRIPLLRRAPVGSVLVALEAKAAMTAHQRALPRLHDELNSSHATIHGASNDAIAVGFTMVNSAPRFLSSDLNKDMAQLGPRYSTNQQPKSTNITIDKIRQLPRRSSTSRVGYDALSITVVDMVNDGTPVSLAPSPPSPPQGDIYAYSSMIRRVSSLYASRFAQI